MPIAAHFLARACAARRDGASPAGAQLTEAAGEALRAYDWPGNVRELRNVIERVMILGDRTELDLTDLPEEIVHRAGLAADVEGDEPRAADATAGLKEMERAMVMQALERAGGNQSQAARTLRISRDALRYKMKKFGLH